MCFSDRLLEELDDKGDGDDSQPYQQYIQASSGIVLNLRDTEGISVRLLSWLKSEEGGIRLLVGVGHFVAIVVGFWLLGLVLNRFYALFHQRVLQQKVNAQVLPILATVSHTLILLLVIVIGLGTAGLEVSAIVAGLGVGGLAFALAAQDTLSNFLGGLILLIQGKVALGQRVEIDGMGASHLGWFKKQYCNSRS